jgi:hypothetical protein
MLAVIGTILAAAAFIAWRIDVWFHPIARCRKCKGTGDNRGSRPGARGVCTHGQERPPVRRQEVIRETQGKEKVMGKPKDAVERAKDKWKFASEKPSSKDFGKSRKDWKASKDAQMKGK